MSSRTTRRAGFPVLNVVATVSVHPADIGEASIARRVATVVYGTASQLQQAGCPPNTAFAVHTYAPAADNFATGFRDSSSFVQMQ